MWIHLLISWRRGKYWKHRSKKWWNSKEYEICLYKKRLYSLSLHSEYQIACCWNCRSTISENMKEPSFCDCSRDSSVLSACLRLSEAAPLLLFPWVAESPGSACSGTLGLLSSSCFMCLLLNSVSRAACILQKCIFMCLCQGYRWWVCLRC